MTGVRCFFCGEAAAPGEDPRSALCESHQAIHGHVVSMQRRQGNRLAAECRCGWSYVGRVNVRDWPITADLDREEAVHAHWRNVVARAA